MTKASNFITPAKTNCTVRTGSRLHFGLFSFLPKASGAQPEHRFNSGDSLANGYGGLGMMLESPATVLRFYSSRRFQVIDDRTERIRDFAQRWYAYWKAHPVGPAGHLPDDFESLPVAIDVDHQAPQHNGLGAGTQLALTVAWGLNHYFFDWEVEPLALATSVGRGLRSAVGTHGFYRGGFLVDRGKSSETELGVLEGAFPFPPQWRVLLIQSRNAATISGDTERQAFATLPDIPPEVTRRLQGLSRETIVPALNAQDFEMFSEGIYDYGFLAGSCFEKIQGGPFANRRLETLIAEMRAMGLRGMGQSSWGPTLFGFCKSAAEAEAWKKQIQRKLDPDHESVMITSGRNTGATVESDC